MLITRIEMKTKCKNVNEMEELKASKLTERKGNEKQTRLRRWCYT